MFVSDTAWIDVPFFSKDIFFMMDQIWITSIRFQLSF